MLPDAPPSPDKEYYCYDHCCQMHHPHLTKTITIIIIVARWTTFTWRRVLLLWSLLPDEPPSPDEEYYYYHHCCSMNHPHLTKSITIIIIVARSVHHLHLTKTITIIIIVVRCTTLTWRRLAITIIINVASCTTFTWRRVLLLSSMLPDAPLSPDEESSGDGASFSAPVRHLHGHSLPPGSRRSHRHRHLLRPHHRNQLEHLMDVAKVWHYRVLCLMITYLSHSPSG